MWFLWIYQKMEWTAHMSLLSPDHCVPVYITGLFNAQWLSVILNDKHQRLYYFGPETTGYICSINNLCFSARLHYEVGSCTQARVRESKTGNTLSHLHRSQDITCNLPKMPTGFSEGGQTASSDRAPSKRMENACATL